jgi:hypothetical protein
MNKPDWYTLPVAIACIAAVTIICFIVIGVW